MLPYLCRFAALILRVHLPSQSRLSQVLMRTAHHFVKVIPVTRSDRRWAGDIASKGSVICFPALRNVRFNDGADALTRVRTEQIAARFHARIDITFHLR